MALTAMLLFHCTGLLETFVVYQCCQLCNAVPPAKALVSPADCGHTSLPVKRKFLLLGLLCPDQDAAGAEIAAADIIGAPKTMC